MRRTVCHAFVLLALLASSAARALTPVCYPTPAEAARQSTGTATGTRSGYRAESRRYDPLLGRSWAVVTDCGHPERPAQTIAVEGLPQILPAAQLVPTKGPTVVHAGSLVRLVSTTANVHLEMPAYAMNSGAVGERIRVRLARLSVDSGGAQVELTAIVRGPEYLELE